MVFHKKYIKFEGLIFAKNLTNTALFVFTLFTLRMQIMQ